PTMPKAHALVIDDNVNSVHVLAGLLAMEDVSSIPVTDSSRLDTDLDNASKIDVVFLDLEMPKVTGYEVLQKLRSDPRFEHVPMVAYTVHISEVDVAVQRGFHSFL